MIGQASCFAPLLASSLFSTLPCLPFPRQACSPESECLPLLRQRYHCIFPATLLLPGLFSRSRITPLSAKIRPALDDDRSSSLEFASALIFPLFYLVAGGQGKCKALFHCSLLLWREHVCRSRRLPAEVVVGFSARFACEKYGPVK